VTVIRRVVLQGTEEQVHFDFDKAVLRPAVQEKLGDVRRELRENPQWRAEIVGHADAIGTAAYNMQLSRRRAEAVRDFLVTRDVSATRLNLDWKGEAEPTTTNDTAEGRAQNRRVEVTVRPAPDTSAQRQ